jgi:hypothetical protein
MTGAQLTLRACEAKLILLIVDACRCGRWEK